MPNYMLDTNALVKYYHEEAGSSKVKALIDDPQNPIFISDLSIVELISSLAKKCVSANCVYPPFIMRGAAFS